ncbi:MAG TPA: HTH domain-containing protein, partial [Kofleriaceae bacterium]|nr:HTH domain-containing protein [Kofleriaceae bacterium]
CYCPRRMNFVDAAVALLREAEAPLHVEDLCRLALERNLLDSPGANPLRSFKGRLTTELKRGDESRVARVEDDLWTLSEAAREGREVGAAEHEHEHDNGDVREAEPEPYRTDELPPEDHPTAPDEDDGEQEVDDDLAAGDEEEGEGAIAGPGSELSPEEAELAAVYGDEVGTAQVGALSEYRDAQTADEDRPMTPEMTGERRGRREREDWKTRRERMRRERREKREAREREREARQGGNGATAAATPAPREGAPPAPEPPLHQHGHGEPSAAGPVDLARRACEVLASVKGGQPVPVKQLAQMMRKRRLVDEDPEKMWRALKSALLADTQRRLGAGLPPRVVYRGRDLFAYRPSGNAELEAAEAALEAAAHRLRGATERALAARLADLALPALEQVAYLYLVQTGWCEIEWIKRVDRSGYATAREPGDGQVLLVGVRAGNQEIDRRGVGELRAGITAKNLTRGLLLAPRELGAEAKSELERPGAPVAVMAGLPWAGALVQAGIAVSQRMVPVSYLDGELLDRLAEN